MLDDSWRRGSGLAFFFAGIEVMAAGKRSAARWEPRVALKCRGLAGRPLRARRTLALRRF
ncbi:MAG TPA: hypothetical protein DIC50_08870 [Verrucomicrobia subdivision 3 bacterium]|nr:hypothetical protein [Limisphaerales bacterium]